MQWIIDGAVDMCPGLTGGAFAPTLEKKLPHQCSKLAPLKFLLTIRRFIIYHNFFKFWNITLLFTSETQT